MFSIVQPWDDTTLFNPSFEGFTQLGEEGQSLGVKHCPGCPWQQACSFLVRVSVKGTPWRTAHVWNNRCLGYGYALKMDWLPGRVGRQSVNDGVASFGQARNVNFGYVIRRFVRL